MAAPASIAATAVTPRASRRWKASYSATRSPIRRRDRPIPRWASLPLRPDGLNRRDSVLTDVSRAIARRRREDGPSLACVESAVNCQSVSVDCLLQSHGDLTPKPPSQSSVLFGCSRELPFALCFDGTNALPVQHEQCFVLVVDELDWAEVGEIEGAVFDEARRIVDHAVGLIAIVAGIRRDATLLDTTAHFHLARQHQVFARAKVFVPSKC